MVAKMPPFFNFLEINDGMPVVVSDLSKIKQMLRTLHVVKFLLYWNDVLQKINTCSSHIMWSVK